MDKYSIEVFQIGKAYQLGYIREIANIAFFIRIFDAPLRGRFAKKRHVEYVGFRGIYLPGF